MQKASFLVLIIYILFSSDIFCQNLFLKVDGNNKAETASIDSLNYLKVHTNFSSVKFEVDSIQNTLYKMGYIENDIQSFKKINDTTFYCHILLKKKFNTIYIYYNNDTVDIATLKQVSKRVFNTYFELNFSEVENALAFIHSKITEKGFPFSKLKLSEITVKDDFTLKAHLVVESAQAKRHIDKVVIKGYEQFSRGFLKHFLKIKPSQTFDLNTIQKKTEQLQNLSFANELKPPEVLFSKDSTSLYLYLEKTKSNAFDGFLGFGTNDDTNKLEFDGYLNLNLVNNLNMGESFRLLYKSDENNQQTFETNITLPYLFKSPIGAELLLRIFRRDSLFSTTNQLAKLHYQIDANHKLFAGILATQSNSLLADNTSPIITDYKTQYITLGYHYIKHVAKNRLFPVKSTLYFETGLGNRNSTNTKEEQTQFTVDAFHIFNLNDNNSIYIRFNGSQLLSDTFFENELFRFGGINSIRGFEENSLFSNMYGLINTEYRLQLNNTIYINSIIDAAYFENQIINTKEKLFGYGFGFGIITKSGLLKFNYANGKAENTKFRLSDSKIHLSLTTRF